MMTKNYEKKVVELREILKRRGITSGISRLKKAELIAKLEAMDEAKRAAEQAIIDEAKMKLGVDFGRAVEFYKSLGYASAPKKLDYEDVVRVWTVMSVIEKAFTGEEQVNMTGSLKGAAHAIRATMRPLGISAKMVDEWTDEECREFIVNYIAVFQKETTKETLHKDNHTIIKMEMTDIQSDENGNMVFDSSKATVLTSDEISLNRDDAGKIHTMRKVETSENGIFRLFMQEFNVKANFVMIFMGEQGRDESEQKALDEKRRVIFTNGFTDIATGIHYNFAIKGPSMDRKANCLFAPLANWDETFDLWFKVTGTKSIDGFVDAFGEEVVLAKMLARVSTRGSSSFDVSKVYPELDAEIRAANVLYVADTETTVNRNYHQLVAPNTLEAKSGARNITNSDGSGYLSITIAAKIAKAMRVISGNKYDMFVALWEAHKANGGTLATVVPGSKLGRLILSIPQVWQIRHGEKKGLLVVADLENCPDGKDGTVISNYDIIIPDSVRKFVGGEWSDYPLEICNYLKRKKDRVYLNPQFVEALEWEDPNALIPIVKDIIRSMEESADDIAKALEFHHVMADDNDNNVASNLVKILSTSASLVNETQVQKWRLGQYEKVFTDLKMCRIPVPGMYSYMVFDPNYFLNATFGTDLPTLQSGEYYHNGLTCECGLFRSPLIHPFEALRVQLTNFEPFWYLQDCIIFNGYDCSLDRMGGADVDGDTCAIVPNNTWQGEIIVNGIRNIPFDVWEPAQKAKKIYFRPDTTDAQAMQNLIEGLVSNAKVDRTGIITNHASRALDIANHLRSAIHFAKLLGAQNIRFIHPASYGEGRQYGAYETPHIEGVSFVMRGIVEGEMKKNLTTGQWFTVWKDDDALAIVGEKSFEEVEEYAEKYLELVEILRVLQGREIDGAKTGVFAEGVSGLDFTDNVKVKINPHCLITRQVSLGRRPADKKDTASVNIFKSLSPWGRVHDYVQQYLYNADGTEKATFIARFREYGVDQRYLLTKLLTAEERAALEVKYAYNENGTQAMLNLVEILQKEKTLYNTNIRNLKIASKEVVNEVGDDMGDIQEEDITGNLTVGKIKDMEYQALTAFAQQIGVSMEVMAAAAYLATYTSKDGKPAEGISFAWICLMELLEIFSRNNDKFGWYNCPNAEIISVKDNVMYADSKVVRRVNAYDTDNALTKVMNGRTFAWLHRVVDVVAEKTEVETQYANKVFSIGAYGFKFYKTLNVEGWKNAVRANNFCFDIQVNMQGRMEMLIGDEGIAGVIPINSVNVSDMMFSDGKRHTVKVVKINPEDFKSNSITNIQVIVLN